MPELPIHGVSATELPPPPERAAAALAAARAEGAGAEERLREIAAAEPAYLDAWAALAEAALESGDPVAAYAFARTGYHRGLDAIRRAGWRGQGAVPWRHESNRGFLRSVAALMRAAAAIGEMEEAERCKTFLGELDPDDGTGARSADLDALRR